MPLFLANGLRQYTMDDLVQELGCSKATLYKYFARKQDLVAAVLQLKIAEIASFAPILANQDLSFQQRYEEAVQTVSLQLAGISVGFLTDLKERYPHLWQQVEQLYDLAHLSLQAFYQEGKDAGILRSSLDPGATALTDRLLISAISDPKLLSTHNIDLQKAFDQYQNMKRFGIFSPRNPDQ